MCCLTCFARLREAIDDKFTVDHWQKFVQYIRMLYLGCFYARARGSRHQGEYILVVVIVVVVLFFSAIC